MIKGKTARTSGFTLIELLVVVAIIAILAALLLPSLSSAKNQAYKIQCLSTLKQFGLGNAMYADSYNNWAIPAAVDLIGSDYLNKWYRDRNLSASLKALLGFKGAFADPAFIGWPKSFICPKATLATQSCDNPPLYWISRSYGLNTENFTYGTSPILGPRMNQVATPSKKMGFADGSGWVLNKACSIYASYYGLVGEYYDVNYGCMTAYRHFQGANIAYYDGHAGNANYKVVQNNPDVWNLW